MIRVSIATETQAFAAREFPCSKAFDFYPEPYMVPREAEAAATQYVRYLMAEGLIGFRELRTMTFEAEHVRPDAAIKLEADTIAKAEAAVRDHGASILFSVMGGPVTFNVKRPVSAEAALLVNTMDASMARAIASSAYCNLKEWVSEGLTIALPEEDKDLYGIDVVFPEGLAIARIFSIQDEIMRSKPFLVGLLRDKTLASRSQPLADNLPGV